MLKDSFPKSSEFNMEHYATLVAHPAPFYKYPEPFLCLVGISRYYTLDENTYPEFLRDDDEEMDLFSFIQTADPTKVRVAERQRPKDEPKLLDATVGFIVPLLPVGPARAENELDASVDRLFDEGGSRTQVEQGDSTDGGGDGPDIVIQPVITVVNIVAQDVIPLQPRRPKKRKTIVSDAGGPSYPPKNLKEDHRTLSGASVGGEPILNFPFVTSSVSAMPEREEEDHTDSLVGANLRTIRAPQRFIISSDSSHHSGANIAEAEVDSLIRPSIPLMTMTTTVTSTVDPTTNAKEKLVESFVFGDGSSLGADHIVGGFSGLTGSNFIVGGIRTLVNPDADIQKMVDEFAPPRFFASIRGMEHDQIFMEFNVGAARQMSLSAEVRMRSEFIIREKRRFSVVVEEKNLLLKTRDEEVANLKAQLVVKEAKAAEAFRLRAEVQALADRNTILEREKGELYIKVADLAATVKVREQDVADLDVVVTSVKLHNDNLTDQVHKLETSSAVLQEKVSAYENFMGQLEKFQDDRIREMNENFDKLDADLVKLALHLEERFYSHLLTTIFRRQCLLTHGLELVIAKCLNSTEYLSSFRAAIGKAVEKGMQEGLFAGITRGAAGRVLTDVAVYNPSAEAGYLSALQRIQSVSFSLIIELKSNKDASIDTIMSLLRLEDSLAKRLGLAESQPHVDQLMVPVHHSPDQTVVGATSLSLSLDVSHNRVQKIKENIANHRSALCDVFIPLAEPLSIVALEGTAGTSGTVLNTTTALSATFTSASFILPISTDDYLVIHTDSQDGTSADGQTDVGADVNPFPNAEDADLDIP
ncbi:hypothetical protein Tco_0733622 [Tanacetum coccineum]